MLRTLDIQNVAVIEKADIEFSAGLNVLTGETGAGKSIVVDSINAVLGERTSRELVRHGEKEARVSALFDGIGLDVKKRLEELDIDCQDDSLLISRKISASGKSSCRINGSPATASMLREIGGLLINIHGQHDQQELLNPDFHYKFIDMLGENGLDEYKRKFKNLIAIRRRLRELTADADDKDRQLELLNYEISELEGADIKSGEIDELRQRKNLILNAENVINALNLTLSAINGDEETGGIETALETSLRELEGVADVDGDIGDICAETADLIDRTETLKDMVEAKLEASDFDESELERIEERLDMYYRFSNKYGANEDEMLSYLENAREKRGMIVNSDKEIERLNSEYDAALEETVNAAEKLSNNRKKTAKSLEKAVTGELKNLDMPNIRFVTDFKRANLSSNGYDKIEFLISTNPGEPPKPLSKIASGGELSRIMLAIKTVIAARDTVPTLIFDEIDTGVSGKASRKIGYALKGVSEFAQVICVTHSAQIASLADTHFLISKRVENERTYTSVKTLDFEERKKELARIMGGMKITENILKSAEELLNGN